jgi:acetyl-CoA acetyltransferase
MARNPMKDQVAIVGVGRTVYSQDSQRSLLDLGLEAARKAIEDAGISKHDIDGISGNGMSPVQMHDAGFTSIQGGLGIPELTWVKNGWIGSGLVYTAQAVHSGLCDYALIVQVNVRDVSMSAAAVNDPYRQRAAQVDHPAALREYHELWHHSSSPYPAMLGRYLRDYGATKEQVGLIAVNNRAWATRNPAAALRAPLTIEDYLGAPPVLDPFNMFDMDYAIDGAEAIVLTTAERARDLPHTPVLIHAASLGAAQVGEYYENFAGWDQTAPWVAGRGLRVRSDIDATSVDLFYPYDGSTTTALAHLEASGFCGPGEGAAFLHDSWDNRDDILRLNGHTVVLTNGGSMSHGRLGGFNSYTEAAIQLRGTAEPERQVAGASTALLSIGSLFHDPAAVLLRTEEA